MRRRCARVWSPPAPRALPRAEACPPRRAPRSAPRADRCIQRRTAQATVRASTGRGAAQVWRRPHPQQASSAARPAARTDAVRHRRRSLRELPSAVAPLVAAPPRTQSPPAVRAPASAPERGHAARRVRCSYASDRLERGEASHSTRSCHFQSVSKQPHRTHSDSTASSIAASRWADRGASIASL